jgi:hypothetical protein
MLLQVPSINGLEFALQGGIHIRLKHYWGSNEERQQARTHLFSQSATLGQPSHFFNITPNSASNHSLPF